MEHAIIWNNKASLGFYQVAILHYIDHQAFKKVLARLQKHLQINFLWRKDSIEIRTNRKTHKFKIHELDYVSSKNIGSITKHIATLDSTTIAVAPYVSKDILRITRSRKINILDLTGKLFVRDDDLYIYSEERLVAVSKTPISTSYLFNTAGIKIIFACLCIPELIENNYRTIAKYSSTSLGSVKRVLQSLQDAGYLIFSYKNPKQRILTNKEDLLLRWCSAYAETYKPKINLGRYTSYTMNWWEKAKIQDIHALWGGEVAGAIVTKNLKPEIITIYAENISPQFKLKYKFQKSSNGEIVIFKKFWNFETDEEKNNLTPHILTYADLIAEGDERNDEIAEEIKQRFLSKALKFSS